MNREVHVRFWEGLGVRFPRATQLFENRRSLGIAWLPFWPCRSAQARAVAVLRVCWVTTIISFLRPHRCQRTLSAKRKEVMVVTRQTRSTATALACALRHGQNGSHAIPRLRRFSKSAA